MEHEDTGLSNGVTRSNEHVDQVPASQNENRNSDFPMSSNVVHVVNDGMHVHPQTFAKPDEKTSDVSTSLSLLASIDSNCSDPNLEPQVMLPTSAML